MVSACGRKDRRSEDFMHSLYSFSLQKRKSQGWQERLAAVKGCGQLDNMIRWQPKDWNRCSRPSEGETGRIRERWRAAGMRSFRDSFTRNHRPMEQTHLFIRLRKNKFLEISLSGLFSAFTANFPALNLASMFLFFSLKNISYGIIRCFASLLFPIFMCESRGVFVVPYKKKPKSEYEQRSGLVSQLISVHVCVYSSISLHASFQFILGLVLPFLSPEFVAFLYLQKQSSGTIISNLY